MLLRLTYCKNDRPNSFDAKIRSETSLGEFNNSIKEVIDQLEANGEVDGKTRIRIELMND
jgi:hypothetical protein